MQRKPALRTCSTNCKQDELQIDSGLSALAVSWTPLLMRELSMAEPIELEIFTDYI